MSSRITLSILIKALNEEEGIARCLSSAVRESESSGGEVILVDSCSTDRTVDIARMFPVRIVQFADPNDRSCGAATQMGYQFAHGEYLYVLDADMELHPGFITTAMHYLDAHPDVAGVGGLIVDTQLRNLEDKWRAKQYGNIAEERVVPSLGGGGLYRHRAIETVGYLANRWLKAAEEAELGMRLRSAGWRLIRLPIPAVTHTGHLDSTTDMMLRLWRGGRLHAYGVLLRSSVGQPWLWQALRHVWFGFAAPGIYFVALMVTWMLASHGIAPLIAWGGSLSVLWASAGLAQLLKKRSASNAIQTILLWHLYSAGILLGFFSRWRDPSESIRAKEIRT